MSNINSENYNFFLFSNTCHVLSAFDIVDFKELK